MGRTQRTLLIGGRIGRQALDAQGGNVAVIFALALPMVVGGLGYGIETTYWYLTRLGMQRQADAAAFAGAIEARKGSDIDAVRAAARQSASQNGFALLSDVEVHNPPTSGPGGANAVEVILDQDLDRVFTGIFNSSKVHLRARAVATFNSTATACILALSPSASKAANFAGNTEVKLTGCSVMSNSVADDAFNLQGSAKLNVNCVLSAGGAQTTSGLTMTSCTTPSVNVAPVADPFRNVPPVTPSGPCKNDNGANLQPGRYCSGMNLKNNVTLQPGVYYIEGGDLRINANADVQGAGVTFYFASGAHANFNGNATIDLSAPTSGTYKGMLMFGDRNGAGSNTLNGTADSKLTGAIYFKNQSVDYIGNFAGAGGCTQVVAGTISWSGSTQINADCTSLGMDPLPAMLVVKLTE